MVEQAHGQAAYPSQMGQVTPPDVPALIGSTLDIAMDKTIWTRIACHLDLFS
jgi:hypothetical protein